MGVRKSGVGYLFYHIGTVQELIIYNQDMTAFMDVINEDIKKY